MKTITFERFISLVKYPLIITSMLLTTMSCKNFLDIGPPVTSLNQENVFTTDQTAIQALTGIYATLSEENMFATSTNLSGCLFTSAGLAADEYILHDKSMTNLNVFYTNNLSSSPSSSNPWTSLYLYVYKANSAIEGLLKSNKLTPRVKQQLVGEAKFIRAFCYFYLVNLYGDLPLVTETDPEVNRLLSRVSKESVYRLMINDLNEAFSDLSYDFLDSQFNSTGERTRPTKWAAAALLARVYLYHKDYSDAEKIASLVITQNKFELLPQLGDVFKKNSRETIWALQPVLANSNNGYNSGEGRLFVLPQTGPNTGGAVRYPIYLSTSVLNNFEYGDLRKNIWTNSVSSGGVIYNYPYKYKAGTTQTAVTEYSVVLRLGEQYLIRAEAIARQGQSRFADAIADLNLLRNRARAVPLSSTDYPLPLLSAAITPDELFITLEKERFSELFAEWGHRWLDLKRTSGFSNASLTRADEIMPTINNIKGSKWNPDWKLWPIPQNDLLRNPNMMNQQNPGYN